MQTYANDTYGLLTIYIQYTRTPHAQHIDMSSSHSQILSQSFQNRQKKIHQTYSRARARSYTHCIIFTLCIQFQFHLWLRQVRLRLIKTVYFFFGVVVIVSSTINIYTVCCVCVMCRCVYSEHFSVVSFFFTFQRRPRLIFVFFL